MIFSKNKTLVVYTSNSIFRAGMVMFYAVCILALVISCADDESANPTTVKVDDFSSSISENPSAGQVLGIIIASSSVGDVSFALTTQSVDGAMSINTSTGQLTVAKANVFDFETNTTITGTVTVSSGDVSETGSITITLIDVIEEEGSVSISANDFSQTIAENPVGGAVLGTLSASSSDSKAVTFTISTETPVGAININGASGELTVADASLFDFETLTAYENVGRAAKATVLVTNGTQTATIKVTIVVTDLVEEVSEEFAIAVTDLNVTIQENVYSVGATLGYLNWSVTSGAAAPEARAFFMMVSSSPSGALEVNDNGEVILYDDQYFNFELYTSITATVEINVPGEMGGTATATGTVTITLTDDTSETNQDRLDDGETPFQLYYDEVSLTRLYGLTWQGGIITHINTQTGSILIMGEETEVAMSWVNANDYLKGLGANYYNGYTDWRMPSNADKDLICSTNYAETGGYSLSNTYWTSFQQGAQRAVFNFGDVECNTGLDNTTDSNFTFPVRTAADSNFQNN